MRLVPILALLALAAATPRPARALGLLPFDPSLLADSSQADAVLKPIIKTVGIYGDHRPYEPATPLGIHAGVDISVEATLVKLPDDLLALQGNSSSATAVPLPSLKLHLHKGLGEFVDIGGSMIMLSGSHIYGADLKVVIAQPAEGPTWALRLCYASTSLALTGISFDTLSVSGNISTSTLTPQILISRELDFADPYLGIGYEYVQGSASVTPPAPIPTQQLGSATASSFMAFTGVSIRIPRTGVRLTLEGSYSSAGMDTLGTKIGFSF
jgi:hypothetical protein